MNQAIAEVKQHFEDYAIWFQNHDPTDVEDKFEKHGYRYFARKYDIPFITLYDRIKKKRNDTQGRPCKLNAEEEIAVVDFLEFYCAHGLPCTEEKVQCLISNLFS